MTSSLEKISILPTHRRPMFSKYGRSQANHNDQIVIPPRGDKPSQIADCKILVWPYLYPDLVENFFKNDLLQNASKLTELANAAPPKLKEDLLQAARQIVGPAKAPHPA